MKVRYIASMEDAYLDYLINLVEGDDHILLLNRLFNEPFVWFVENDSARCDDGTKIREQFAMADENYKMIQMDMASDCNLLEVIIGLAYRMASMTAEIGQEECMTRWFWEMLDNVGLEQFSDDYYLEEGGDDEVSFIIEVLLNRDYEENGVGSLFPLRDSKDADLTKVELWYQMSAYLNENEFKD